MIWMIFCTRSRHAEFPIHRVNLRWARTNSPSLRLTYAPFPTLLDRGQSLNMFKDRPRPSRPCRYVAVHCRSVYDRCRSIHFIHDWSRFSNRLRSGTDRSPVEWGYNTQIVRLAIRKIAITFLIFGRSLPNFSQTREMFRCNTYVILRKI